MTKYKAIGDSVLISVPELEKVSQRESGLFLIENDPAGKTTVIVDVVSVGEGKFDQKNGVFIPPPVKVGDKIIIGLAVGMEVAKGLKMVKTEDIFAVIDED